MPVTMNPILPIPEFRERLERLIQGMSPEALREAFHRVAQQVPPAQREAFLAGVQPTAVEAGSAHSRVSE